MEELYELRDSKFGSANRTLSLRLTQAGYNLISSQFNNKFNSLKHYKSYSSNGSKWTLFIRKYEGSQTWYNIYGISGDYSFGSFPTYMKSSLSGNKKVAKEVFTKFINENFN